MKGSRAAWQSSLVSEVLIGDHQQLRPSTAVGGLITDQRTAQAPSLASHGIEAQYADDLPSCCGSMHVSAYR